MPFIATYIHLKNKIQAFSLFKDVEKTSEEDLKNQRILNMAFPDFTFSIYIFSTDLCIFKKCDKNYCYPTAYNSSLQRLTI